MKFGDVALAAMVFSDASGVKKRPVLVIDEDDPSDLLVVPITSHPARSAEDVSLAQWKEAGLKLPSTARMSKLATIAKSTIDRRLGKLEEADRRNARNVLAAFLRKVAS